MATFGLDIGGAGIKASDGVAWAKSLRFPLWKTPFALATKLASLRADYAADIDRFAVTMTGELCDCFETKETGVKHILSSARQAFGSQVDIHVWRTTGDFIGIADACADPWKVAAGNWSALATWVAARYPAVRRGLLIDIGSTTTDIIPFGNGVEMAVGRTDPERLASGELVYHGVERTPICAVLSTATVDGTAYRLMNEWFATAIDVYLVLGDLPEDAAYLETADGRPATIECARARLARMIGSDSTRFSIENAIELAQQAHRAQRQHIGLAADAVAANSLRGEVELLVLCGQGEFLAREVARGSPIATTTSISNHLSSATSNCACAFAVASLYDSRRRTRKMPF